MYDPLAGLPRVHRMGARKVAARRTDPHRARTRTRSGPAPGPAPGPHPDPHPDPHRARTGPAPGPTPDPHPGPHRTDSPRPLGGELALIQLGVKAALGQQLVVGAPLERKSVVYGESAYVPRSRLND